MQVIPYELQYAEEIASLLNNYLPFEPEDAKTVDEAQGVRYIAIIDNVVVGYIAGYEIRDALLEFPYFEQQLQSLHQFVKQQHTMYTSHFVVHPHFRQRGIGSALVKAYLTAAEACTEAIVVVGWVQSDTNVWAAERQFLQHGFTTACYVPRYFEPYNVYCPSCNGSCYCDAHIVIKQLKSAIEKLLQ